MKKIGLIVIGNEVLNGSTLDTNSHFMCQFVEAHGSKVMRISTIPDDPDIIINEIQRFLNYVDIIFTFGGLGPTNDDLTLKSVSDAISNPLIKNQLALSYVEDRYKSLSEAGVVEKNPSAEALIAREKMAYIPKGATPLWNPVGAAPAVITHFNEKSIISLPGVPREITAICSKYAQVFEELLGKGVFVSFRIITSTNDESELASVVKTNAIRFPDIYIKSRPIYGSDKPDIGITISGAKETEEPILKRVSDVIDNLTNDLKAKGISIVLTERII